MRKALFSFLMIAMLTPLLVCGTAMSKPAKADTAPCHEQGIDENSLMFMIDCMNVDLQAAGDQTSFTKPNQEVEPITFAWIDSERRYDFSLLDPNAIRGPPSWELTGNTAPPIIFITQRFLN